MTAAPHADPAPPIRGWLARVAFANTVGYSATTALPLWLGLAGAAYGLSPGQVGLVATVQLAAGALLNLLSPAVSRRLGIVTMGVVGASLSAFADLTIVLMPTAFVPAAILSGASLGLLLGTSNRLVGASPSAHSGFSILQIAETMFGATFYLVGPPLLLHWGLTGLFLLLAAVKVVAIALIARIHPPVAVKVAATRTASPGIALPAGLTLAALVILFAGQAAIWQHVVGIGSSIGVDPTLIGQVMALTLVGGFGGAVLSGMLGARYSARVLALCGAAILAVGVLMLASAASTAIFAAGAIVLVTATMFVLPNILAILADLDHSGRWASVAPGMLLIGVSLGPSLSAVQLRYGDYAMVGRTSVGLIAVAIAILMLGGHCHRRAHHSAA